MVTVLLELHRTLVSDHIRSCFGLWFSTIIGGSLLRDYEIIIIVLHSSSLLGQACDRRLNTAFSAVLCKLIWVMRYER